MPLCLEHHAQFHAMLRTAGINLEYTSDPMERLLRAQKACEVFHWTLTEALQNLNSKRATSKTLLASR
jgi:hypothetical protein